jgi:hypothetical protein
MYSHKALYFIPWLFFAAMECKIIGYPQSMAVMVGETARITCHSDMDEPVEFVSWRPGQSEYRNIQLIYESGILANHLQSRVSVERDLGLHVLVIRNVTFNDAATYRCRDEGGIGERAVAQLIVVDPNVTCTSNIRAGGMVAGNVPVSPESDYIIMSCVVKYTGNVSPIINFKRNGTRITNPIIQNWFNYGQNHTRVLLKTVARDSDEGINFEYYVTMPTNIITSDSITALRNTVSTVHVLYLSALNITRPSVTCPIETNMNETNCIYKHIYYRINIANQTNLSFTYACVTRCKIDNKTCIVSSPQIRVRDFNNDAIVLPSV